MLRFARYELLAMWFLWLLPFGLRRIRSSGPRSSKTAPVASIAGMVLQAAAYPLVSMSRRFLAHPLEPWQVLTSGVLGLAAVTLAWSALPALGKQWRLKAGVYVDHVLVQTGPYRLVRHPIYSSMLCLLLATAVLRASLPVGIIAAVVLLTGTEIRVRAEERLLRERFGAEFDAYKARVPAYIPYLR